MTALEELSIINRVCGGETEAFEALVLDNQNKVYALALKLTGSADDAQDMAQEAFLRAFTGLKNFRGESRFSVWLYRLTYNLCIDLIRKRSRTAASALTYTDDGGETAELEIPDTRSEPSAELERREIRRALSDGIASLPLHHREIIVMREVTGMSYEDISKTLGISEGTVKSRLSRARQSLADKLRKKEVFPNAVAQPSSASGGTAPSGTFPPGGRQKTGTEVETHD